MLLIFNLIFINLIVVTNTLILVETIWKNIWKNNFFYSLFINSFNGCSITVDYLAIIKCFYSIMNKNYLLLKIKLFINNLFSHSDETIVIF